MTDPTIVVFILDGKPINKAELAAPIRLGVGEHELVAKRADGSVVSNRKFAIGANDKEFAFAAAPEPAKDNGKKTPDPRKNPDFTDEPETVSGLRAPLVLEGHTLEITALWFSPDGKTFATGSSDKTVIIWDMARRRSATLPTRKM